MYYTYFIEYYTYLRINIYLAWRIFCIYAILQFIS